MITIGSITLDNFTWLDQFSFSGVMQQQERALNGAPHIESTVVSVGRPITLNSELENAAIFTQLQAHALATQQPFNITINGTNYSVVWVHNPIAVSGTPVVAYSDAPPNHFQNISLTLQTA